MCARATPRGAAPNGHCDNGYATDDIFFLEVCMFNQLCKNGDELFGLQARAAEALACRACERRDTESNGCEGRSWGVSLRAAA